MKCLKILLTVMLFALLAGCVHIPKNSLSSEASDLSSTANPSSKETGDVSEQNVEPSNNQPPLKRGEWLIAREISVNQLEKKFGPYIRADVEKEGAFSYCDATIKFKYVVCIIRYGEFSCITNDSNDENGFSKEKYKLTKKDKEEMGHVLWIAVREPVMTLLREIKIGDSLNSVKDKFLDKTTKYNDSKTLYMREDYEADGSSEIQHVFSGKYMKDTEEVGEDGMGNENTEYAIFTLGIGTVKAEEGLKYKISDHDKADSWASYEATVFWFYKGKLVEMVQYIGPHGYLYLN